MHPVDPVPQLAREKAPMRAAWRRFDRSLSAARPFGALTVNLGTVAADPVRLFAVRSARGNH